MKTSIKPKESVEELLARGSALVQTSQPEEALPVVLEALHELNLESVYPTQKALPTLSLLAEIELELGAVDAARSFFVQAAALDPDGSIHESEGGGAEKFFWLAQLSEEGGHDSVSWFEKGITVLRNAIGSMLDTESAAQKRKKMAAALCGVVEIYMTDLSWESDAESRCESLMTEAMLVAPESPEVLQTLASVRISQMRIEDARKVLTQSIEIWKNLPGEDEGVPEFPTRISLARLLMEVDMEDEAMEVLERLVDEDDNSVEAWYLGGWCQYLMVQSKRASQTSPANIATAFESEESALKASSLSSRDWLRRSLGLCKLQEYEDQRLREHALELVRGLDAELGDVEDEEDEDGVQDDEWESAIEDEDEEMDGT
ncbi:MAG: hypothetical protein Q9201_007856 [Fulgogasparrea decipioides]